MIERYVLHTHTFEPILFALRSSTRLEGVMGLTLMHACTHAHTHTYIHAYIHTVVN